VLCGVSFHFIGSLATLLCFGTAKLHDLFSCWGNGSHSVQSLRGGTRPFITVTRDNLPENTPHPFTSPRANPATITYLKIGSPGMNSSPLERLRWTRHVVSKCD
jgi:hypothetical protein